MLVRRTGGAERPEAERAARQRSDDAVRHEVVPALEALHGALGLCPENAVGCDPELLLDAADCRAAVAALDDDLAGGAGAADALAPGSASAGTAAAQSSARHTSSTAERTAHGIEDPCHLTIPLSNAYEVS